MTEISRTRATPTLRLAYLNTRYPALSHTFIQREVERLRDLGVEVHTFSVRRPSVEELGPGADDREMRATTYLVDGAFRLAAGLLAAFVRRPLRVAAAIRAGQRLSPPGWGPRLRHFAYAVEAVRLAGLLRRRGLTELHVHMANNGALVALLAVAAFPTLRYSLTIHGSAEFFDVVRLALREKAERALFVRFVSEAGRALVMGLTTPSAWSRFHVVHCGVDTGTPARKSPPAGHALRILAVGRLTPVKGYPLLLRAVKALDDGGTPWSLRIVGDGPQRAELEDLAARLGLGDRVRFLGPLPPAAVRAELDAASVLAVSSFMEGIPVVLMEAMAAGVPVVATRVGGVPELVEHGSTGLLVPPGSEDALVAALARVAEDPLAAASRAATARTRVETDFDDRRSAGEMAKLLARYHAPRDARSTP